jgi:glycosyltransferase involved in cell wall biosynthesis
MTEGKPLVTVVMPVRNEGDFIARSLGAVLAQDYPPDRLEVLVVDGCSQDETRAIISAMAEQTPIPIILLDNPRQTAPAALNIALREAQGDIIVRVDGHCEIAPDYISRCAAHLAQNDVDGVGGAIETVAATRRGRAIAAAMSSHFGVGDSAFRTVRGKTMLVDTIPFPAYTRRAIERAGPFDEEMVRNQDDEYNYRLRSLGGRLLLAADIHARYASRSTLASLWRQYFQYGYYKVRVLQKHPRQMRLRQFAPPLFVLALALGGIGALANSWALYGWLALIGLYGAASTAASLWAARQAGWDLLIWLPPAFATLHLSYGAGFLAGLLRFWRRWAER